MPVEVRRASCSRPPLEKPEANPIATLIFEPEFSATKGMPGFLPQREHNMGHVCELANLSIERRPLATPLPVLQTVAAQSLVSRRRRASYIRSMTLAGGYRQFGRMRLVRGVVDELFFEE